MAIKTNGITGVFWCYPAVVAAFAMLPITAAGVSTAMMLAWAAVMLHRIAGAEVALQFTVTLLCEAIALVAILNMVATMRRTLGEQVITDPLTGAFNRRHLETCLVTAIERRKRTDESASLLLLDVDHFKSINDTWGHAAGDEVLIGIVQTLRGRLRPLDSVFRLGGEEFAVLLSGAGLRQAVVVAEALRRRIAGASLLTGRGVSVSVGVSELHTSQSPAVWMAAADAAVYRAKQNGRNRVAFGARAHLPAPAVRVT
jgi:diguanylate cyclase (GGDEF)-like protein